MSSVAIVVLNFNGGACLHRCLESLRKLHYQNKQVIVVDNGSTDASLVTAQKEFPEYTYIQKPINTGFASGMNTGMAEALAKGHDFVWLMNYDAVVMPETLKALVEACLQNPEIEVASPRILDQDKESWFCGGKINFLRMRVEHAKNYSEAKKPYKTSFLTGCALFIKSSVLKEVGLLDERFFLYYEDADFSVRVRSTGRSLWIVPAARVVHEEKSQENPRKLYHLVLSGMLFFALHTPLFWRPYIAVYVTIRRVVNQIKFILGARGALRVHEAYADYFAKFQPKNKLYLRKLS